MNYIIYYIGVVFLSLIAGLIVDLIEIHSFKKQLKEYNLLYPSFKVLIPTKLKDLIEFKRYFEDFIFIMNMRHYTAPLANLPLIYKVATERKNDDEETHTN